MIPSKNFGRDNLCLEANAVILFLTMIEQAKMSITEHTQGPPRTDPDIGPSLRSRFRKWSKKQGLQSSRPDRLVVLSVPRYGKVA